MLKLQIIAATQKYCVDRASNQNLIFNQLEELIEKYERNSEKLGESEIKLYQKTKLDFQQMIDDKTNAAIFRSGMKYYNDGEMPSKFFFSMEKNRSGAKNMSCLIKANGQVTYKTKEILNEQKLFFEKLYRSNQEVTFNYKNESGVKLDETQKQNLEGEIQIHEATATLKAMKRNVSPGSDGLTTEFFICLSPILL